MSGILAVYNPNNSANNNEVLQAMAAATRHRGKDGHGIWTDGAIGIGHQRFATTPEARFEQSPSMDDQGFIISADVRLDNREALIAQLQLEHLNPDQLTDPILILHAYQAWGNTCTHQLLGAFAFILWDPIKHILFGARDHLGVKPFYYFQDPNFFAIASEIKALLRCPQINGELDPIRIADLLTSQLKDQVKTAFKSIQRLPAAHQLERTADGVLSIQQYWQLDPTKTLERSDEEYVQEFQSILKEAVHCRLRRCVPLGSQLSGGMDSSSITAIAETLIPETEAPLHTFSATFAKIPECDETDYIQAVLETGRYDAHFVAADNSGPLTHWQKLFQILDEPALGNGYLSWLMNAEAHAHGVEIVLNGYDGDTTIGHGALYPYELARAEQWKQALAESRLLAQRFAVAGATPLYLMRKTAFEVLTEFEDQKQWGSILRSIPQIYRPLQLNPWRLLRKFLIRPLWRSRLAPRVTPKPLHHPSPASPLNRLSPLFLKKFGAAIQAHQAQFHPNNNAPVSVRTDQWQTLSSGIMTFPMELLDQVSAAFQIEPRYPLMDKRLVEFCLALPPNQKLRQGWSRYILRQSMEDILPAKVQWRGGKTNLSNAFHYGLNQYDQDILNEVLQENPERLAEFIDISALSKEQGTNAPQLDPKLIEELWPIITLSMWIKSQQLST